MSVLLQPAVLVTVYFLVVFVVVNRASLPWIKDTGKKEKSNHPLLSILTLAGNIH